MNMISNVENATIVFLDNKKFQVVKNFQEASDAVTQFISFHSLGASSFYKNKRAGQIYDASEGYIAHVSYNGRVWAKNGNEIKDLSIAI